MNVVRLVIAFVLLSINNYAQGPYAPAAEVIGSTAVHKDSSILIHWASNADLNRGWMNVADTSLGYASVGDESSALGEAGENGIVSLGDGGSITLSFDGVLYNGEGFDFAIFENSFSDDYLELAHVEVSSDGENFFLFPSISLTQTDSQIGGFGLLDPSYLYNLAGKYRALYGTPFDLEELTNIPGLDINFITHIRIRDVVGSIDENEASYDSEGISINDPFPTPFPSSGFDLDAVGLIHWDLAASLKEESSDRIRSYPNPFHNRLSIVCAENDIEIEILNVLGHVVWKEMSQANSLIEVNTENWEAGIYIVHILNSKSYPLIKY